MVKHIPNLLSAFRILVLIAIILCLDEGLNIYGFVLFLFGIASDVLDGYLARKHKTVTKIGIILDPLADKILVIGILIALIKIMDIPYWMVIVIVFRECAVTGLRVVAASENIVISANIWGKLKTTSQFVALSVLILGYRQIGIYLLFIAVILTLISGYIYFYNYFKDNDVFA